MNIDSMLVWMCPYAVCPLAYTGCANTRVCTGHGDWGWVCGGNALHLSVSSGMISNNPCQRPRSQCTCQGQVFNVSTRILVHL